MTPTKADRHAQDFPLALHASRFACLSSANTQFPEQKCVVERKVAERIVAAGSAPMSGAQVHFEKQRVKVRLERAEFGHKFCAFPIRDLAVIERGPDQH